MIAGFLPICEAVELTNIGILLAFVVGCIAVVVCATGSRPAARSDAPVCPWCRWSASGSQIWLISFLDPVTWLRFAVWFALGLVVYLLYGRRRSRLARNR